MGCAGAREKIEDKMMLMKLERMEIQMEKEKELKKLAEIEGHTIRRQIIPDYIDPKFAKEKQIYDEDDDENEEIGDKKTDNIRTKDKKGKNKGNKDKKDKKENKDKKDKKDKNDKKDKKNKKDDDKKKKKKK